MSGKERDDMIPVSGRMPVGEILAHTASLKSKCSLFLGLQVAGIVDFMLESGLLDSSLKHL